MASFRHLFVTAAAAAAADSKEGRRPIGLIPPAGSHVPNSISIPISIHLNSPHQFPFSLILSHSLPSTSAVR
jgi:hypothetical protein